MVFLQEWDSRYSRLCSALASPSVARAHPLHEVLLFQGFSACGGWKPYFVHFPASFLGLVL